MSKVAGNIASSDRPNVRPWIVCESSNRWFTASRRFVPAMMPAPLVASIIASEPDQVRSHLSGHRRGVVFWEISRENLNKSCEQVALLSIASPKVIQIAAAQDLSREHQCVLGEFGVAAFLRHPEDLPRWSRLVEGYFARSSQHLD